jgi:hypothetical protein
MWRPFGCPAYAHLEKPKRDGKFPSKAVKCLLLGYAPGMKAYRLFNLKTRKIFALRHVTFDEADHVDNSIFPPEDTLHDTLQLQREDLLQNNNLEDPLPPDQQTSGSLKDSGSISNNSSDSSNNEDYPSGSTPEITPPANSESISFPPTRRSESQVSQIPIKTKVEQIVLPIPSIAKASVPSTAPITSCSCPTPPVSFRQSMGPPPAPKRPNLPAAHIVAGSRHLSRTVVLERRNAAFIKATDEHNQSLKIVIGVDSILSPGIH